jgi:hypothetical protein
LLSKKRKAQIELRWRSITVTAPDVLLTGSTTALIAALAGGTALIHYLNARYQIGKDVGLVMRLKRGQKDYEKADLSLLHSMAGPVDVHSQNVMY